MSLFFFNIYIILTTHWVKWSWMKRNAFMYLNSKWISCRRWLLYEITFMHVLMLDEDKNLVSSIGVGFSLCLASKLLLPFSMPRAAEYPVQNPRVHRALGLSVLAAGHRVVASCDSLLPRRAHSVLQRPSMLDPTKPIDEPGRLEMDSKSLSAEPPRVPGGAPSFAVPTLIHCLAPLF